MDACCFGNFFELCQYSLAITCSSAVAERVFSILKNSFHVNQNLALEDYISLSVMTQYNRKK